MTATVHAQPGSGARFDWGLAGAAELGRVCAVLVVVDVLSFTTAVEVAVARGMRVHPFPWGEQAAEYARRVGAVAAVGRRQATPEQPWSLSPAGLRTAPAVADLVLPSPNGSAISAAASATGLPVVAACLRNARAVGRWLTDQGYGSIDAPVGVVASGERWPDGSLRPCVEDQLGAACVLDALSGVPGGLSVEAAMALAALAATPDVPAAVRGCVSGRELVEGGFGGDVEVAVQVGVSGVVPVLRRGVFSAARL
ncbi:2-phosphosulfolactate phosphatase [Micromonospora carbonacea]|uniref:Probable 2-phosphosulfolactate phosphatase n=1 Tax=Micromonospora carbonacea TaxID=47853 RepID=A0A7H8XG83_9ACTN|nr:2-phosphosulfolactate phosphatase [Micromonospora carbonacea]MBB5829633.1 2-phosphosulfolactate phosphatase [Micromonospora carbonacea]QLD22972.1 2-phosphosulfolactate phosphatase [Micromonospora carbonacea]